MVRDGATVALDVTVDYTITPEEARSLGITNYKAAVEFRQGPG